MLTLPFINTLTICQKEKGSNVLVVPGCKASVAFSREHATAFDVRPRGHFLISGLVGCFNLGAHTCSGLSSVFCCQTKVLAFDLSDSPGGCDPGQSVHQ